MVGRELRSHLASSTVMCVEKSTQNLSVMLNILSRSLMTRRITHAWIYAIKHKHEVFQTFVEWKRVVEKSSGHRVKKLRTDNGGEYTSAEFESYLKKEGILQSQRHLSRTGYRKG